MISCAKRKALTISNTANQSICKPTNVINSMIFALTENSQNLISTNLFLGL